MTHPPDSVIMVVHGPDLFDCGDAVWLMQRLCPERTIVAGVMARTAAEESGLPVEFDGRPPSRVIASLTGPVVLANRGKTPRSGEAFGDIVASRLPGRGLVHVECSSRTVYCWDNGDAALAFKLAAGLGYEPRTVQSTSPKEDGTRTIRGCIPGEAVFMNGIVIGYATQDHVVLRNRKGAIEPVSGLEPKAHGIEKAEAKENLDISTAWCKSGRIRSVVPEGKRQAPAAGRILVIDHCGHEIYARMPVDCCGVLAIGDDTTSVCGHICTHRGIPVLGIVDGDCDVIVPSAFAPGSVVAEALHERDDDLGREVAKKVADTPVIWNDWVDGILAYLRGRVRIVLDLRQYP